MLYRPGRHILSSSAFVPTPLRTSGELIFRTAEGQHQSVCGRSRFRSFFSLVIDYIGYKTVACFAIGCHTVSLILTLWAEVIRISTEHTPRRRGQRNGRVFHQSGCRNHLQQTEGEMAQHSARRLAYRTRVLGALCGLPVAGNRSFLRGGLAQFRFALCFIPVVIYALLILPWSFLSTSAVAALNSYRDMPKEVGAVGFFIISALNCPRGSDDEHRSS
ncbi:MAG: hypothetical protein R3F13_02230 [Prosthecobacter sp.]